MIIKPKFVSKIFFSLILSLDIKHYNTRLFVLNNIFIAKVSFWQTVTIKIIQLQPNIVNNYIKRAKFVWLDLERVKMAC